MNNSQQPATPLSRRQLFLGIRRWVRLLVRNRRVGGGPRERFLVRVKLFQSEIMRDTEDPAAKILP
jgi:hypothetical protein